MIPTNTQFDQYIHFGRAEHAEEFTRLHKTARLVAYVASSIAKSLYGELLTTTSIYRPKTKDSGIHSEYRAIDFAPLTSITQTYRLIAIINSIFIYDEERKKPDGSPLYFVADPNPYHGTGLHIHIQVHDHTTDITKADSIAFLTKASHDKSSFKPITLDKGVTNV